MEARLKIICMISRMNNEAVTYIVLLHWNKLASFSIVFFPSGTVSHALYHPLVYRLLPLVHEVHFKRFYEIKMVFIFGEKKPCGQSDSVILFFPILLNSSY